MTANESSARPRIPREPPRIPPPPSGHRPLWSVLIPIYNQARYLQDSLGSVLRQDPGADAMQILVADDASTDQDVRALVARLGGDRVECFRQPENAGSLHNMNDAIGRARGHYVHLLHGDDRVLPGFYATMEGLFAAHPEAGASFCGVGYINEEGVRTSVESTEAAVDGVLQNWLLRIAVGPRIQYASIAVRRSVYEDVGGYFGVTYAEDWEMHTRIASRYPMAYTPRVLAEYRIHQASISGNKIRSGGNLDDMAWVISQIQNYLPSGERPRLRTLAEKECAGYGLHYANQLWRMTRDREGAEAQLQRALQLCGDDEIRRRAMELRAAMAAAA